MQASPIRSPLHKSLGASSCKTCAGLSRHVRVIHGGVLISRNVASGRELRELRGGRED